MPPASRKPANDIAGSPPTIMNSKKEGGQSHSSSAQVHWTFLQNHVRTDPSQSFRQGHDIALL